jgi:DNA adenine methylase Dam
MGEKYGMDFVQSPLNYTGGKYKLLPQIIPLFYDTDSFIDLFCGGGNVGINVKSKNVIMNDIDSYVIRLLKYLNETESNVIIHNIENIVNDYHLSESHLNGIKYYNNGHNNWGLSHYNKENYLALREDFNDLKTQGIIDIELFFAIIMFSFNNQIRFNKDGYYNMPVGKSDFNKRLRKKVVDFSNLMKQKNIAFMNKDFRKIDFNNIDKNTLIYCDVPYLITDSVYNKLWTEKEEQDLFDLLNSLKCKFALSNVFEVNGKSNDLLIGWSKKYNVHYLNYDYGNASYHKKDRVSKTVEVLVTNY